MIYCSGGPAPSICVRREGGKITSCHVQWDGNTEVPVRMRGDSWEVFQSTFALDPVIFSATRVLYIGSAFQRPEHYPRLFQTQDEKLLVVCNPRANYLQSSRSLEAPADLPLVLDLVCEDDAASQFRFEVGEHMWDNLVHAFRVRLNQASMDGKHYPGAKLMETSSGALNLGTPRWDRGSK